MRALTLTLALSLTASSALAADPADLPPPSDATGAVTAGVEQHRPFWHGSGPTRGFMAAVFALGVVHFRPTIQFGYGKPHYSWIGAEATSGIAISGGRLYAGVHGKYPGIDARVGVRYEYPVDQHFLPPLDLYTREDIETEKTALARYLAAEAQIDGNVSVPGGSLIGVLGGYYLRGVPEGQLVFEESLKIVVEPPWLWRARLGYLLHIGWIESMKLGAAAEVIHVPARETVTVRVGPLISVGLTHHLEVNGGVMLSVYTPDDLGLTGADIGQLGLVYRWATGDRWADFP